MRHKISYLAAEGAAAVVNYASSKEEADRVVDEIVSNGGKAIAQTTQQNLAQREGIDSVICLMILSKNEVVPCSKTWLRLRTQFMT